MSPHQLQQQQPLQEINQEDLAAILPDQQNDDTPFDGFEETDNGRLVSKAIERIAVGGDSDSSEKNPIPVYSSSLLQQFAEKTNQLIEPRKRRNRVVKKPNEPKLSALSNVSPDSGIQSVNNSPMHLVSPISPPSTSAAIATPAATAPTQMQPPAQLATVSSRSSVISSTSTQSSKIETVTSSPTSPKKRGRPVKNSGKTKNMELRPPSPLKLTKETNVPTKETPCLKKAKVMVEKVVEVKKPAKKISTVSLKVQPNGRRKRAKESPPKV